MSRKEIQQHIQKRLQEVSGSGDIIEIVGNVGISYNRRFPTLTIIEADSVEYMDKMGEFSCEEHFFQFNEVTEIFGNILENSERIRWNKIRNYLKEVY